MTPRECIEKAIRQLTKVIADIKVSRRGDFGIPEELYASQVMCETALMLLKRIDL